MSPPIDIDGSEIQEATIDGQDVSEITIDGQQAAPLNVIPDSGLKHQYDATALSLTDTDDVSTWPDKSGSEDATAVNPPTYRDSGINGNPSVEFVDSSNQYLNVDYATTIPQPLDYFAVIQLNDNNFAHDYLDGYAQNIRTRYNYQEDRYQLQAGQGYEFGSNLDTNATIATSRFDGANSELRLNGTGLGLGNPGTNGLDGLHIGTRLGGTNTSIDGLIGEILIYDASASGYSRGDVESYLSDKWGIAV